jgi:hypothetical protein
VLLHDEEARGLVGSRLAARGTDRLGRPLAVAHPAISIETVGHVGPPSSFDRVR